MASQVVINLSKYNLTDDYEYKDNYNFIKLNMYAILL